MTVKRVVAVADVGHNFVKPDGGIFSNVKRSLHDVIEGGTEGGTESGTEGG